MLTLGDADVEEELDNDFLAEEVTLTELDDDIEALAV